MKQRKPKKPKPPRKRKPPKELWQRVNINKNGRLVYHKSIRDLQTKPKSNPDLQPIIAKSDRELHWKLPVKFT